jgi:hypothetical protein
MGNGTQQDVSDNVEQSPGPFLRAPVKFAVHAVVGTSIFATIAVFAIGLNIAVQKLETYKISTVIIDGLEFAEYTLFATDLTLFVVFLWRTAKRTLKHLWTLTIRNAREAAHLYFEPIFSGLRFGRERLAFLLEKRRTRERLARLRARLRARRVLARELVQWEWELARELKRKLERLRALRPEQVREQQLAQVWALAQELEPVQERVLDLDLELEPELVPEQVWEQEQTGVLARELVRECLRELERFAPPELVRELKRREHESN